MKITNIKFHARLLRLETLSLVFPDNFAGYCPMVVWRICY